LDNPVRGNELTSLMLPDPVEVPAVLVGAAGAVVEVAAGATEPAVLVGAGTGVAVGVSPQAASTMLPTIKSDVIDIPSFADFMVRDSPPS
jgi:hypothetical protein